MDICGGETDNRHGFETSEGIRGNSKQKDPRARAAKGICEFENHQNAFPFQCEEEGGGKLRRRKSGYVIRHARITDQEGEY